MVAKKETIKDSAENKTSAEDITKGLEMTKETKEEVVEETKEEVVEETKEATLPEEVKDEPKEEVKKEEVKEANESVYVTITNTSQNTLCLTADGFQITIFPREIKQLPRHTVRELLHSEVIRRWFDKGIIATNMDANEESVHEAEAPNELKGPVERHDGVNITASVKKFVADGSVKLEL